MTSIPQMKPIPLRRSAVRFPVFAAVLLLAAAAVAQTPAPAPAPAQPPAQAATPPQTPAPTPKGKRARTPTPRDDKAATAQGGGPSPLAPLAWLEGCWRGEVNGREFREHWMPLRGNMLVGMSQTVLREKTQDFEYLRLEARPDGVYYVALPSGRNEVAFKLTEQKEAVEGERKVDEFVFTNPALEFPQKIAYRHGTLGWLYAIVSGKVKGEDKETMYPMRRIDCQSGELLLH
jgi:hypothetical protein